jgi:hypothetical protein
LIELSAAASLTALTTVSDPTIEPPNGLSFELPTLIAPDA